MNTFKEVKKELMSILEMFEDRYNLDKKTTLKKRLDVVSNLTNSKDLSDWLVGYEICYGKHNSITLRSANYTLEATYGWVVVLDAINRRPKKRNDFKKHSGLQDEVFAFCKKLRHTRKYGDTRMAKYLMTTKMYKEHSNVIEGELKRM